MKLILNTRLIIAGLIFLVSWILSPSLYSQNFSKKYFIKTSWFSNNKDSAFYKEDTIRLIKYINPSPEWTKEGYAEYEMKYLSHGDYIQIGFNKFNQLILTGRRNNYIGIVYDRKSSWMFRKKNGQLTICLNNSISSFVPIKEQSTKIESKFAEQKEMLTTTELILVRAVTTSRPEKKR